MDFNKIYQNIINELKADQRPRLELEPLDLEKLVSKIRQYFKLFVKNTNERASRESLNKTLCIANFLAKPQKDLWPIIYEILENTDDSEVIVTTIGLSEKHIVGWHELNGEAISFDFIKALKKLIYSSDSEVQEWALRVIAGIGSKAIILRPDLEKIRPGFKRFINSHAKSSHQIIEMLLKRWSA